MNTAPDSALTLMQGLDGAALRGRSLRARHALLTTMAEDKCYIPVAEDSLIRTACDHYRRHGSKENRLKALYYLGVVHHNAGRYPEAAREFREAEQLAERLGDNHHLGLVCWHLCDIYAANYDHVRAMEYAQKELKAFERAEEPLSIEYSKMDVARRLMAEYRDEEAIPMLKAIMEDAEDNDALYSEAILSMARALISQKRPDYEKAYTCFQQVIERDVVPLNSHVLGDFAIACEGTGNSEEADHFLSQEAEAAKTAIDSVVYFNTLHIVSEKRGDLRRANGALMEAVKIQNRVVMAQLEQSVTHSMEEYYEDSFLLEQERSRSRTFFSLLIGLILSVAVIWMVYLLRQRKRRQLEDMATIQEVSEDLKRQRSVNAEVSGLVDRFIQDKVQSLQDLSVAYFSWDEKEVEKRKEKNGREGPDEIFRKFRRQVGDLRRNRDFIQALEQSLDLTEDHLMVRARQSLIGLDEEDFELLTLLFSGFSVKSICYLYRMSEPAMRMRKTRYKQLFGSFPPEVALDFRRKLG